MAYEGMRKSIRQKLAWMLSAAIVVTSLSFGGATARAEENNVGEGEKTIAESTINFEGKAIEDVAATDGLKLDSSKFTSDASHGLKTQEVATVELNLEKNAKLTVTTCCYGSGAAAALTGSAPGVFTRVDSDEVDGTLVGKVYTVTGASGKTVLTFASDIYIHSIEVEYVEETIAADTYNFVDGKNDLPAIDGLTVDNSISKNASHGLYTNSGATVTLNLSGSAKLTVTSCAYNQSSTGNGNMTVNSVQITPTKTPEAPGSSDMASVFTVTGASGETTLTFENDMYIHSIKVEYVTAGEEEIPTEWNFRTGSKYMGATNGLLLQPGAADGTTATVDGLEIKASVTGAKWDSKGRTDWAQFNKGTTVKVPVSGSSKITLTEYNNAGQLRVDGKPATEPQTFIATGKDGYATITAEADTYLGSIKVEAYEIPATPHSITVTTDDNGTASANKTSAQVGDEVTLTATPKDGYKFKAWEVVSGGVTVADNKFTMGESDVEIKATFKEIPAPTPVENPLTTIVKTEAVDCEGGSYTLEDGVFTIHGAGTQFGKDTNADSLYYVYFDVPEGTQTITAKLTPGNNDASKQGYVGMIAKNGLEEDDFAAGFYYDYAHSNVRIGKHGGAGNIDAAMTDALYVKLEFSANAVYYTVARDAEFKDVVGARNGMGATGLDARTVGFFATADYTLTVSDVELIANYTEDGASEATHKIVYSSKYGELIPTWSKSESYSSDFEFSTSVNGNELSVVSDRSKAAGNDKGDIRSGTTVDYLLFPQTAENWTVQADVQINSINSGTDKQGIAVGIFAKDDKALSILQANKNAAMQHNYNTGSSTNGGNPKGSVDITSGATYTMQYTRYAGDTDSPDGYAIMNAYNASGVKVVDGTASPFTLSNASAKLNAGQTVSYGLAISAADVVVSNMKLFNEDGYLIYDQNDYYIAEGVAPVVQEVTAAAAEDRLSINVQWTNETEGVGNVQYMVMVSKDGGEYTLAGTSKVCEFAYQPDSDGSYTFKVYGKSGDDSSAEQAKVSNAVDLVIPIDSVVLSAVGDADGVTVRFDVVGGATSYDIYRQDTSDGEANLIKTLNATEAVDGKLSYKDTPDAEIPVYYYVIAKNATNTSNPCETQQALRTAGHSGEYLAGNEADALTITSKNNDTVFDGKFEIKGSYAVNGSYAVKVNGEQTASGNCTAGEEITLSGDLADGRNDVEVIFTNASGQKSRKAFNFVNNPYYDILVDAAYTGTDGEKLDGVPVYKTINAALATVAADNAKRVTIFVKNGAYNERIEVKVPQVSILGEDAQLTKIQFSAAVADKTATSMWNRNAMYVDTPATGFTLENIWVENTYNYTNGSDQQADALAIAADNVIMINVTMMGYQDTLLVDSRVKAGKDSDGADAYEVTNQYFYKCYITGNVDFIYGSGSAAFEDCDVVGRYTSYKADGCFTAARTYSTSEYGLVFNNCRFYGEEGIGAGQYRLARPWGKHAGTVFLNCYMDGTIASVGYGDMSGNSYKKARFAEYNTYGAAFAVNNDRPLLSAAQAEKYATQKVLGEDFEYQTIMAELYAQKSVDDPTPDDPTPDDPTPDDPTPVDPQPEDPTPVTPGNSDDDDNDGAAEVVVDVDWEKVAAQIDDAAKSKAPKNLDVTSGDRYEVPVKVLNKLKGKNTTLALHAGGGITLSITGTDIKKNATAPFKVAMSHGNVIPAGAANQVLAGAAANRMFSMEDKSVYPFPVNVHVNLGASNAGKTAYMYYYDEKSNSMVLAGSFRITATGQAMFAIYRGDEYIIVVSDKAAAVKGKYIVVKGDNLTYIAKKTGVTLKKLIGANPQIKNVNRIVPGQEINLP